MYILKVYIKRYSEILYTFALVGHTTDVYKISGYLFIYKAAFVFS